MSAPNPARSRTSGAFRRARLSSACRRLLRPRNGRPDGGFGLIEVIVALTLLGGAVLFLTRTLTTSVWANTQASTRAAAAQVASATMQELDNLGYSTVSEGLSCPTGSPCSTLAQSDPNGNLHYSNGCWYFGAVAKGLLVPTTASTASDPPVIPYVSGGKGYPNPIERGVTFTVATYPMFQTAAYPAVTCTTLTNGSAPDVPVIVVIEVTWTKGGVGTQHLVMQTELYSAPPPAAVQSGGANCPGSSPQAGAHLEALLASPNPAQTVAAGATAGIFFLDEQATPYLPSFCVEDSAGGTAQMSLTYTVTQYGTGASDPFLPTASNSTCSGQGTCSVNITAVHASYAASGPNAAAPPTGGTYCGGKGGSCATEEYITFTVPSLAPDGLSVSAIEIADWDHEGDLDTYAWNVS